MQNFTGHITILGKNFFSLTRESAKTENYWFIDENDLLGLCFFSPLEAEKFLERAAMEVPTLTNNSNQGDKPELISLKKYNSSIIAIPNHIIDVQNADICRLFANKNPGKIDSLLYFLDSLNKNPEFPSTIEDVISQRKASSVSETMLINIETDEELFPHFSCLADNLQQILGSLNKSFDNQIEQDNYPPIKMTEINKDTALITSLPSYQDSSDEEVDAIDLPNQKHPKLPCKTM